MIHSKSITISIALLLITNLFGFAADNVNINVTRQTSSSSSHEPQFSTAMPERTSRTQSVDLSYVLSANDLIEILVFEENDLTTTTRVSQQGSVTLPLVGSLQIGGLNIQQATENISKVYREGYLRDPKISITVIEFAKKRFHVLGQVQKPGSYEMPQQENVNILQAVSMAGGYTLTGDPGNITVKRTTAEGKDSTIKLNAKQMAENKNAPVFLIQHNDTITVSEFAKKRFHVLGQVQKPGSYEIPQQENMNLLQAIAMAGGYTRIANPRDVTVKRITENGKEVTMELNAKVMAEDKNAPVFQIQHDDTITVSESIF